MGWNIETSFKKLKYTVGMMSFHSKKRKFIQQEIFASILLYNLSSIITEQIKLDSQSKIKYEMKINYTVALTNIRKWLKNKITTEELLKRQKISGAIRPDRKYKRNMRQNLLFRSSIKHYNATQIVVHIETTGKFF